jgi:hypothetical protein
MVTSLLEPGTPPDQLPAMFQFPLMPMFQPVEAMFLLRS